MQSSRQSHRVFPMPCAWDLVSMAFFSPSRQISVVVGRPLFRCRFRWGLPLIPHTPLYTHTPRHLHEFPCSYPKVCFSFLSWSGTTHWRGRASFLFETICVVASCLTFLHIWVQFPPQLYFCPLFSYAFLFYIFLLFICAPFFLSLRYRPLLHLLVNSASFPPPAQPCRFLLMRATCFTGPPMMWRASWVLAFIAVRPWSPGFPICFCLSCTSCFAPASVCRSMPSCPWFRPLANLFFFCSSSWTLETSFFSLFWRIPFLTFFDDRILPAQCLPPRSLLDFAWPFHALMKVWSVCSFTFVDVVVCCSHEFSLVCLFPFWLRRADFLRGLIPLSFSGVLWPLSFLAAFQPSLPTMTLLLNFLLKPAGIFHDLGDPVSLRVIDSLLK